MSNKSLIMSAALSGLLLASGYAYSDDSMSHGQMAKGQCHGVNDCKGHGECKGAGNSCEGHNECKGKGWVKMSQADCETKGGKFVAKSH